MVHRYRFEIILIVMILCGIVAACFLSGRCSVLIIPIKLPFLPLTDYSYRSSVMTTSPTYSRH